MKVWFDADNGPHVLIMRPLVAELQNRGHEVVFTARDRTSTCELLQLYDFPYLKVGGEYGAGMTGKILGTLGRSMALVRAMCGQGAAVSFGHGSRALPIASGLLGVPTVTMYDYEWVNARLFNMFCRNILLPDAITLERCEEAGISTSKAVRYRGFKEELYLGGRDLDESIPESLGLRPEGIRVLLRPPATTAHYHNPEAEVILDQILTKLATVEQVQLVFLPRTPDQRELPARAGLKNVIIPDRVYDGPSMVACMDMVISGGGTMTREAAIMGVPSYSFFKGRNGMVDDELAQAGGLVMLSEPEEVAEKLLVQKNTGSVSLPDPAPLVRSICDAILAAAS